MTAPLATFCDALILPDPDTALRFIEDRRAEGMTLTGVYLGYISGGARCLGERWERDELSFLQVTCGSGHLYALMRALRSEISLAHRKFDGRRVALFLPRFPARTTALASPLPQTSSERQAGRSTSKRALIMMS